MKKGIGFQLTEEEIDFRHDLCLQRTLGHKDM